MNRLSRRIEARWTLLFLVLFMTSIASCGGDDPSGPNSGNEIQNALLFTRQDGSDIQMGTDYAICCATWEEGFIDDVALKVFFYDQTSQGPSWKLFIIPEQVTVGNSYSFPTIPNSPLKMFLLDGTNELSSDQEEAAGSITVSAIDCGPPVSLRLTVDVTLGSEFAGSPFVQASGTFSANIQSSPLPNGCDFGL